MTILVTLILVILMGALILASLYGIGWLMVELEDYKIKKTLDQTDHLSEMISSIWFLAER